MLTAIVMLPLMGGLAVGVDYAEMTRQRSLAHDALNAASIGTARRYLDGNITPGQLQTYAEQSFAAHYDGLDANNVALTLVLPNNESSGDTLKLSVRVKYLPSFLPVLTALLGDKSVTEIKFDETSEVRLSKALDGALVPASSGSMPDKVGGSGTVRTDPLMTAAKQPVDTLSTQSN